jgi:hypothetical protein
MIIIVMIIMIATITTQDLSAGKILTVGVKTINVQRER